MKTKKEIIKKIQDDTLEWQNKIVISNKNIACFMNNICRLCEDMWREKNVIESYEFQISQNEKMLQKLRKK